MKAVTRPAEHSEIPDALWQFARQYSDAAPFDPAHDFLHLQRVLAACLRWGAELGADLRILRAAALLHDYPRLPKSTPKPEKLALQKKGRAVLADLLEKADYTPTEREVILEAIHAHSYSLGMKPPTLEAAILQDADRLDGIGAIGILRTASTGVLLGARYYRPEDPFGKVSGPDDLKYTLDHFPQKLLKLAESMNTAPARLEARQRHAFMVQFLRQLEGEVAGLIPSP